MNYPSTNEAAPVLGIDAPNRRYWLTLYSGGHSVVDIRPCMIGPAVRAGMLLHFAAYFLKTTTAAMYVEVTPDTVPGASRPVLAVAWIPDYPHGACRTLGIDTHVTQEGLGLL